MLECCTIDYNIGAAVVAEHHQVWTVVRIDILGEVLHFHCVVLGEDERLVVQVEVLKRAVSEIQRRELSRVHAYSTREVVQVEEYSVTQVEDVTVIFLKEQVGTRLAS